MVHAMIENQEENLATLKLLECGLEELIDALVSRQPIATASEDELFVLENDDARRILAYYARNRQLWARAKQVQATEIEDVLKALSNELPGRERRGAPTAEPRRRLWRLKRVEAHRFGGLHRHCGVKGEDPEDLVLEIERDVTLISGFNGAGKTALQNVIIWCLTGRALRSQHMPDEIHEPMEVYWAGADDEERRGGEPEFGLPPIVPIPSAADMEILGDQPKIDTWAQLTFQDEESQNICVVRRALVVSARGKITTVVTGRSDLGLSDLALEAGTLMPGIAAHMRFDEKTTFAQAIAQLTGLKPLEDLGRRSARVVKRLTIEERKKAESEISACLVAFEDKRQSIDDAWSNLVDLGSPVKLTAPTGGAEEDESKTSIAGARRLLEEKKRALDTAAEVILGRPLQLASKQDEDIFLKQLNSAGDLLGSAALNGLPSVSVIRNLRVISEQDGSNAEVELNNMVERATTVWKRLSNKQEAARWQLYARVAAWHREHHEESDFENCPLCGTDLSKVPPDALVNKDVKDALRLCAEADADAAKGAHEWEGDAAREFLEKLPESLRAFAEKAPTGGLLDIYRKAYVEELLADKVFGNRLAPLKENAALVWKSATNDNALPDLPMVKRADWPEPFRNGTLAKRAANVAAAIRLSRHRAGSADALKAISARYFGEIAQPEDGGTSAPPRSMGAPNELPVRDQLNALRMCLRNTAPIASLMRQLDGLEATRQQYASLDVRLRNVQKAADAIESFAKFEMLVFQQVSGLIEVLHEGTKEWLGKIYAPHYVGGPSYSGFDIAEEKGIGLRAGIGDMQVPAHQVMNASLLRACVWAFALSLWERVRSRIGGIDCLLLDDPQTHFDPINSENLAAAIPQMPSRGIRPVITSNDHRFLAAVRDKLPRQSTGSPSWHALRVNPISRSRLTASVSPAVEEIYEQQQEWSDDENNSGKAQNFVRTVRLYVENRLWNLLATDPIVIHKPTLADLVQALRTARNNGERPFDEPAFEGLLSYVPFREGSPFYQIINKAHHRLHEVTPAEAQLVSAVFGEIDRLLRSCSASYARFMGRLTGEEKDLFLPDLPPCPQRLLLNNSPLPMIGDVAARAAADLLATSRPGETIELQDLGAIALYGVKSPGLGAIALQGQVVIASLEQDARDGDPVVALHDNRIYLRRLHCDGRDASRVALVCDRTGTDRVAPTALLAKAKTRLMPIVGVLYDHEPFWRQSGEACHVESCKVLDRKLVAARVSDDSAHPLIRSGDVVLLEPVILDLAEIARLEDRIVVAEVGSPGGSFAYLKRLGGQTSPGIRILENVGIKGRALTVAIDPECASGDVPSLQALWRVHGTVRF
jgi:hypothetical protein